MYLRWAYQCLKTVVMGGSSEVSVLPITTTGLQKENPSNDESMWLKLQ